MNEIEAAIVYGDIYGSGGGLPGYPAYAKSELNSVVSRVNSLLEDIDDPLVIVFHTDPHIDANTTSASQVATRNEVAYGIHTIRDFTKVVNTDLTVHGGDTYGGGSPATIKAMQDSATFIRNQFKGINSPFVMLVGNHEGGQDNENITRDQVYASHVTDSQLNNVVIPYDRETGYYDIPSQNVRVIFLDAFPRSTIVQYSLNTIKTRLTTMLSEMPEGYKAIIFSHHPIDENLPQVAGRKGWNNPTACHEVLQTYKDKIICCVNGHVHNNLNTVVGGITFISTTCAGKYELNDGSTRTNGTASVTAYDVFVIDQENEMIHCVRYGNGQDRDISYAPQTLELNCYQGSIGWDDGVITENSARVYSAEVPINNQEFHVTGFGNGLYFSGRFYDSSDNYVAGLGATQTTGRIYFTDVANESDGTSWGIVDDVTIRAGSTIYPSVKKMRLVIKKSDGTDMSPSDVDNMTITIDGTSYKLKATTPSATPLPIYQGTIGADGVPDSTRLTRVYTGEIPVSSSEYHIIGFGNGYWFGGRFYDGSGNFTQVLADGVLSANVYFKNADEHSSSWGIADDVTIHVGSSVTLANVSKLRLIIRTEDGSDNLAPSDVEDMEITVDGVTYKLTIGT